MAMNIPLQDVFFYQGNWNPRMDTLMLSTIIRFRDNACWEGSNIPPWVLNECGLAIQGEFGIELTISELTDRLRHLQSRHHTFKEVVHTTGASWVQRQNFVAAADCVWDEILKNTFAAAYYHRDEPEFNLLASLFALDDVKLEDVQLDDTPTVIVISDSSGGGNPIPVKCVTPSEDEDEVNSPAIGAESKVRRKLFVHDESPTDCQSSTMKDQCHVVPLMGAGFQSKMKNKPPRPTQPTCPHVLNGSPFASSCASCSPLPASRRTAP
ncbi:uncharacterized protein LOC125210929 isoform X2 [Salvia hispanica]|uniref:uncharacterized protein LOC125210929 isoform X2 n=1 Tax=Salvia hispanica TaxID=49212 RepID=UPI002009520F|nr:uncharacterized protein LOC125210929 isoform X2 [Salvia hispanica]